MACGMLHLFGYPAPRDASPLPAGDRVHRLLAADQHLLERLHGPARLQPGGLPAEAVAAAGGAGGGDAGGVPGHLGPARLPVVLAPRDLGLQRCPTPCSGASWGCWSWSTSSSTRGGAGTGPGGPGSARRLGGAADRARALAVRGLKTAGTFTTIALLWSLWSSPSLAAWLDLLRRGLRASDKEPRSRWRRPNRRRWRRPGSACCMSVALLLVGFIPWPQGWAGVRELVDSARSPGAEPGRARGARRGLLRGADRRRRRPRGGPRRAGPAAHGQAQRTGSGSTTPTSRAMLPGDFLQFELLPGIHRTLFGRPFVTNSHGMHSAGGRDREAAGHLPDRRARGVDGHGLGRGLPGDLRHQLEDWLNAARRPPGPRGRPAVRGAQLRGRRLQPAAAAGVVPPQGDGRSSPTW